MSTCIILASPFLLVPGLLLLAAESINLVIQNQQQLTDVNNCIQKIDCAIRTERGELIGIRHNKQKNITEFVLEGIETESVKKTINKIKQAYSRIKILDEVKKKGYKTVKEEKLPDGSIRLVVQKWQ